MSSGTSGEEAAKPYCNARRWSGRKLDARRFRGCAKVNSLALAGRRRIGVTNRPHRGRTGSSNGRTNNVASGGKMRDLKFPSIVRFGKLLILWPELRRPAANSHGRHVDAACRFAALPQHRPGDDSRFHQHNSCRRFSGVLNIHWTVPDAGPSAIGKVTGLLDSHLVVSGGKASERTYPMAIGYCHLRKIDSPRRGRRRDVRFTSQAFLRATTC